MGVKCKSIPSYQCICDVCGRTANVEKNKNIYNGAQAVRSLGWSFGKDRIVKCNKCRQFAWNDHYLNRAGV